MGFGIHRGSNFMRNYTPPELTDKEKWEQERKNHMTGTLWREPPRGPYGDGNDAYGNSWQGESSGQGKGMNDVEGRVRTAAQGKGMSEAGGQGSGQAKGGGSYSPPSYSSAPDQWTLEDQAKNARVEAAPVTTSTQPAGTPAPSISPQTGTVPWYKENN